MRLRDKQKLIRAAYRGAKLLDKHRAGWRKCVNLKKFDIEDPRLCVLGQVYKKFIDETRALYDGFDAGTDKLSSKLESFSASKYGFIAPYTFDSSNNEIYEVLGQEWIKIIKAKKKRKGEQS